MNSQKKKRILGVAAIVLLALLGIWLVLGRPIPRTIPKDFDATGRLLMTDEQLKMHTSPEHYRAWKKNRGEEVRDD